MKNKRMDRRNFIKACVTAAAGALPAGKLLLGAGKGPAGSPTSASTPRGCRRGFWAGQESPCPSSASEPAAGSASSKTRRKV